MALYTKGGEVAEYTFYHTHRFFAATGQNLQRAGRAISSANREASEILK